MREAPYCRVTYKTCKNPNCRRAFAIVARSGGACEKCRRCRRDGYCSMKCKFDALAKAGGAARNS